MDTDVDVAMSSSCGAVTSSRRGTIPWRVLSAMVVLSLEATDTPVNGRRVVCVGEVVLRACVCAFLRECVCAIDVQFPSQLMLRRWIGPRPILLTRLFTIRVLVGLQTYYSLPTSRAY